MRYSIILLILFLNANTYAQEYSTTSRKAISHYENAMSKMQVRDYSGVIESLENATKADKGFIEAWLLMADTYDLTENYRKVEEACKKAIENGGEKYEVVFLFMANAQFRQAKYEEAIQTAEIFLKKKISHSQKTKAEFIIKSSKFAISVMANPVPFEPLNLGDSINSEYEEYWPSISVDNKMFFFSRTIPKNQNKKVFQEDIFLSKKQSNYWSVAEPIGPQINSPNNEGRPYITSDGTQLIMTIMPYGGSMDIYYSNFTDTGWSGPINIGAPINTKFSERQACISSDKRTLYFNSDRPGGKGKSDIWYSVLDPNGNWGPPINMGDSINTAEYEQAAFIHSDNETFYFSSNGHIGMGGFDIYMSKKNSDGIWVKPVNVGYPINTHADEVGLIIDATGENGYFASSRLSGKRSDIFSFKMPAEYRPQAVSYFKGKIFDAETLKPLQAAFELINLNTQKTITKAYSHPSTGNFLLCLPVDNEYALNVSKKNYIFYSDYFSLDSSNNAQNPFIKDIALQPIKPGQTMVLKNIFFETNSSSLLPKSEIELQRLEQFLKQNPTIKIEISGHTDNTGSEAFNKVLSEKRAQVVWDYLIQKGVATEKLAYKGYGETKPIDDNNTPEGRSQNRRTEFKILP